MKMNLESIRNKSAWEALDIKVPEYDVEAMIKTTKEAPSWVHFGAGNIFRGFIAAASQRLLNQGIEKKGIIAAETFDCDIIDKIYKPFDNLTLNVILGSDSTVDCEIIASVAEALKGDGKDAEQKKRLDEIFTSPTLQIVSFTITEKGYALNRSNGELLSVVSDDINNGPDNCHHIMSIITSMMYQRYLKNKLPIALLSIDNCSHNGEKLNNSVVTIAKGWLANGYVEQDFISYLTDETKVSFPWSMIDKITPRPKVKDMLEAKGIEDMEPTITEKGTYIAPFVNAERAEYLVIEDNFPNGRPALEKAGVYMTDRETVNKTERMKVTTCLNPLHTAMSVYGCLLNYSLISEEMKDPDIVELIKRLGYTEGLPVVTDPGIISPKEFIDQVMTERLPNPFMPDDPHRIVTDTSQKVGIRFGETIKGYVSENIDLDTLTAIPLAIAGWFRYLLGVDDSGNEMEVSSDPLKDELQAKLKDIQWNKPESYNGQLISILSSSEIFGSDLTKTSLANKIEQMFVEELSGKGAVRNTLKKYLS